MLHACNELGTTPAPLDTSSVLAAAALVLAFFALRPRKGWVRTKAPMADVDDTAKLDSIVDGGVSIDTFLSPPKQSASVTAQPASTSTDLDTLIPHSFAIASTDSRAISQTSNSALPAAPPTVKPTGPDTFIPHSSASTGSRAKPVRCGRRNGAYVCEVLGDGTGTCCAPPLSCSTPSQLSDPLLTYISSYVASRSSLPTRLSPPGAAPGSGGSGSVGAALHSDEQVWEVQWEELAIERPIGRGSFGDVYLAQWNHTQVVSVQKGGGMW